MDRAISLEARRIDLTIEPPFLLGAVRVDPRSHEIARNGELRRIQPLTMKVLVALHDKIGQVVTRDELVERCWDGRLIGDDVINRSISLLRRLAASSGGFDIETVPKAGYRLVEKSARSELRRRRWAIPAVAAGVVALSAAGLMLHSAGRPPPSRQLTIAPLPFVADPSNAETAKLASASREAVANTLAQGEYDVSPIDSIPEARRSPADFLISGQVTSARQNIVAAVRMEETAHHVIVFSHQFEEPPDKADDLPEIIGAQVASQLSWTAPLLEIERRHPSDPTIIASLLQTSSAGLDGGGTLHDYETSRRLATDDPNSPLAQTTFAFNTAFALDEIPHDEREQAVGAARIAAVRATSLAPEFGDNYAPWCLLHSEQRRIECEDRLRAGMRADPDAPFVAWFLAQLILNPVGREAEALELARASLAHDPYMPNKIGLALRLLEAEGQSDDAEQLYRQAIRWWPNDRTIIWYRASGMAERGDFEAMERFNSETGGKGPTRLFDAINRKSLPTLRAACVDAEDFEGVICMLGLARFGDLDGAFALADRLYPSRGGGNQTNEERIWLDDPDPNQVMFLTAPVAAPLRRDPRYIALALRVGLLPYWRSGRLPDFCTKAHEPICAQVRGKGI